MKVQNLARSKQSARDFLQSIHEPIEAVVGDQTYIVYPAAFVESLTRLFSSRRVHEELRRAMQDVREGNFVEYYLPGEKRSAKRSGKSGKRSKP